MKRLFTALLAIAAALSVGTGAWPSSIGYPGSTTLVYDLNGVGKGSTVNTSAGLGQCNVTVQGVFVATMHISTSANADFSSPILIATVSAPGTTAVPIRAAPIKTFAVRIQTTAYTSGHPLANIDCGGGQLVNEGQHITGNGAGGVTSVTAGASGNLVISPTTGDVIVETALDPTLTNIELTDLSSGTVCYDTGKSFHNDCDTYDATFKGVTTGVDGLTVGASDDAAASVLWGALTLHGALHLGSLSDGILTVASGVVGSTNTPTVTSLTISSLANAPCIGGDGSGVLTAAACPSPGPFLAGRCIGITGTPAPTLAYTCASPTPEPSPIAGSANVHVTGTTAPYTISVDTPAPPTLHAKLAIAVGFMTGALSTSTIYPYQPIVGYTSGQITGIRIGCATNDNGNSSFTLTDITASATIGSITMTNGSAVASTTLGSPYALTAGHVVHLTNTVAGTATSCGIIAEGQQAAF